MTRPKPETSLVKSCLAYLHAKGVMAWKNNTGMSVSEYKGRKRIIRYGQVGSADILGIIPTCGRMIAVECKVGNNKLTPEQESWLGWAHACGALVIVARSVDDLIAHFGE